MVERWKQGIVIIRGPVLLFIDLEVIDIYQLNLLHITWFHCFLLNTSPYRSSCFTPLLFELISLFPLLLSSSPLATYTYSLSYITTTKNCLRSDSFSMEKVEYLGDLQCCCTFCIISVHWISRAIHGRWALEEMEALIFSSGNELTINYILIFTHCSTDVLGPLSYRKWDPCWEADQILWLK